MKFEAKEKTKVAEDIPDELHKKEMKEVLVAFITVESGDEDAAEDVASEAAKDILSTKEQVKAERIMLYPYAHLSNDLGSPKISIEILNMIENLITEAKAEVVRAPFGWYKSFEISCKGHPLSELSRDITGKSAKPAVTGKDTYFILTEGGNEVSVKEYRSSSDCMKYMIDKEALGIDAPAVKEPDYLRLCKKFGIQWESMSDAGHMSLGPHGAMMFDLISDYATDVVNHSGIGVYNVKGG